MPLDIYLRLSQTVSPLSQPVRHRWMIAAFLMGAAYALIGVLFALPQSHGKFWRLAAWAASAILYAAHIIYERVGLRNPPPRAALHVSSAAALGAFGLAVAAN